MMVCVISAVLLDLDGTVLDTTEFFFAAFAHTAKKFGFTIPSRAEALKLVGPPLEDLYNGRSEVAIDTLCDTHRTFQEDNLQLLGPFPGAAEVLAALRASGLAIAGVTNRSNRTSEKSLSVAGLLDYFDAVVSAEDSPALKPDPAPLRLALARLGRPVSEAVMVGDTAADIGAGLALGIPTIAATYGFTGEAIATLGPTELIHDIRELPAAIRRIGTNPLGGARGAGTQV
jgi:pyrophosphatase PpaX